MNKKEKKKMRNAKEKQEEREEGEKEAKKHIDIHQVLPDVDLCATTINNESIRRQLIYTQIITNVDSSLSSSLSANFTITKRNG